MYFIGSAQEQWEWQHLNIGSLGRPKGAEQRLGPRGETEFPDRFSHNRITHFWHFWNTLDSKNYKESNRIFVKTLYCSAACTDRHSINSTFRCRKIVSQEFVLFGKTQEIHPFIMDKQKTRADQFKNKGRSDPEVISSFLISYTLLLSAIIIILHAMRYFSIFPV